MTEKTKKFSWFMLRNSKAKPYSYNNDTKPKTDRCKNNIANLNMIGKI